MSVVAKLNYLRIAPRKVRLLADLIRGKSVEKAQTILSFTVKKSTIPLLKLLNQAVANAQNNFQLDAGNLYISKITVDEGPKHKRWRPRARGQAYEIQKKTSHITLVLDETPKGSRQLSAEQIGKKLKKAKKAEKQKTRKRPVISETKELKKEKKEEAEKPVAEKPKTERPKLRIETEARKPKIERAIRRIFRRKAF